MRIIPYRTYENVIDGVVITFMDITVSKKLEAELRRTQAVLENRIVEQAGGEKPGDRLPPPDGTTGETD